MSVTAEEVSKFIDTRALIAKERRLRITLLALEKMLSTVQDLRTKVNFERAQLISLIQMAKSANEIPMPERVGPIPRDPLADHDDSSSGNKEDEARNPLLLLDQLYNGEFCMSEEEDEDEEEGDNFGVDNVEWLS